MKNLIYLSSTIVIALGAAVLSGCGTIAGDSPALTVATTTATADSGTLVIKRAPNMGTGLFLDVAVDGKRVGIVRIGQRYSGPLPAGPHEISVLLCPNNLNLPPTEKKITVQPAQTYTFTACWRGETVVLL